MPIRNDGGGSGSDPTSGFEQVFGIPSPPPPPPSAPATAAGSPPLISGSPPITSNPLPGQNIQVDASGNLPVTIARTLVGYEYAYVELLSTVTVSGTSAAQTTIVAGPTIVFDGTTSIVVEFFDPQVATGASDTVIFDLWDDITEVGLIAVVAGNAVTAPVIGKRRFTPTKGPHTYTVKAYRTTNNGAVIAGVGGSLTQLPGYLRVTRA